LVSNLSVSKIEITTDKILYDEKSKILSIDLVDFTFIGHYSKSTKIAKILDDVHASLKDAKIERKDLIILDSLTRKPISEALKLKDVKFNIKKEEIIDKKELLEEKESTKKEAPEKKKVMKKEVSRRKEMPKSMAAPPAPSGGPPMAPSEAPGAPQMPDSGIEAPRAKAEEMMSFLRETTTSEKDEEKKLEKGETPEKIIYDINMGFQYYSVMMEQRSYLFYVFFSHKELKIVDEEGKIIYETSIQIITTKKEPPILDLKIEGAGFEVHPLSGKVEVKKEAVNPPVMIFSILPIKNKNRTKALKKEGERRFLNIYVTFENKVISHTVLSVIVQPKHFHLDLGPLHLDISKNVAILVSFISILITTISVIYSIFSFDVSSAAVDVITGFVPGMASFIFVATYLISLAKGIYPLKQKWSSLLNFDKASPIMK